MNGPKLILTQRNRARLELDQLAPFGAAHLPLLHAAIERERPILTEVAAGLPRRWELPDRVLVVLEPVFRRDVERYYQGKGGDISSVVPEHLLPRADGEFTRKLFALVFDLRAVQGGERQEMLRQLQGRRLRKRVETSASGEPGDPHVSIHSANGGWIVTLLQAGQAAWRDAKEVSVIRVVEAVCARQEMFLAEGLMALAPMSRAMIAGDTELHESTVSRVVGQVLIETPLGRFMLRDLFVSGVRVEEGGERSILAAKAMLAELIQSEAANEPLTDSDLVLLLKHHGYLLARRTVAKYREAMGIPRASARRIRGDGAVESG